MILEALINLMLLPVSIGLNALPILDFNIPLDIPIKIAEMFKMVSGFLPFDDVIKILSLQFMITNWRLVWNVVQRVWDALPLT